ncbi:hypothetical protein EDD21DRAFT_422713 [Dissophora ornata]|nr:hypothetical protein EDD21DRAFT_422713 [Dissophora ornata]
MPPSRKRPYGQINIDPAINISHVVKQPRRSARLLSKAVKTTEQNAQEHAERPRTSEFASTASPRERSPMITMAVPYPGTGNPSPISSVLPNKIQAFYDVWELAKECKRRVIDAEKVYRAAVDDYKQLALSVKHEVKSEIADGQDGQDASLSEVEIEALVTLEKAQSGIREKKQRLKWVQEEFQDKCATLGNHLLDIEPENSCVT